MKKTLILLFLILITSVVEIIPQKKAFTISDLYKIKYVGSPVVSPGGNRVAFTVTSYNLKEGKSKTQIYVMNSDGSDLMAFSNRGKSGYHPVWVNAGNLDFVSDSGGTPQLYNYSFQNYQITQVTHISTGVTAPVISPNGKLVAFSTKVYPECGSNDACNKEIDSASANGPIQAYLADHLLFRHWTTYSAGKYSHIFIYNFETKTYTDLTPGKFVSPTFMLGGGVGYNFSPDSKELSYVSNHAPHPEAQTNADLWIIPVTGGKAIDITKKNKAWDGWPIYSPNGKYIAYRTQKIPGYESDRFRLALYNRITKQTKIITPHFDNWVDNFKWSPDSKIIYFTAEDEGYSPIFKIDIQTEKISQLSSQLSIFGFDVGKNNNYIYY